MTFSLIMSFGAKFLNLVTPYEFYELGAIIVICSVLYLRNKGRSRQILIQQMRILSLWSFSHRFRFGFHLRFGPSFVQS